MQREGIVNGVNMAGKAASLEDEANKPQVRKPRNRFVDSLMSALSVFGHLICPIKDNTRRK